MKISTKILTLFACVFILSACNSTGFNQQAGTEEESASSDSSNTSSDGGLTVYFSKPDGANASAETDGPENNLLDAINKASISIDVAIYELSLRNITESLIRAHQRAVRVRVLTDTDHLNWTQFKALDTAGIAVKGDQRSALMHNKFTVIDNEQVWTGSMNYTYSGAYHNDENLLQLDSLATASAYSEEFAQLWVGIHRQINASASIFSVNNSTVEVYFSPDDHFRSEHLIPLLKTAKKSVHFMAFSFTSTDIAETLVNLKQQGIEIKGVFDASQAGSSHSQYDDLKNRKIEVFLDGNTKKLHHKVMIIDQRYVVTGSYNFSQSAETRNDENSLIIENNNLAARYEQEFTRVYQKAVRNEQKTLKTFLKFAE